MMAIGSAVQYTSIGELNPIQRFLAQTRLPDRWYKVGLWRKSSMVFQSTGNGHVGNSTWNTVCAVTVPLSTGQHEQHEPSNDMIHQVALQPCSLAVSLTHGPWAIHYPVHKMPAIGTLWISQHMLRKRMHNADAWEDGLDLSHLPRRLSRVKDRACLSHKRMNVYAAPSILNNLLID